MLCFLSLSLSFFFFFSFLFVGISYSSGISDFGGENACFDLPIFDLLCAGDCREVMDADATALGLIAGHVCAHLLPRFLDRDICP